MILWEDFEVPQAVLWNYAAKVFNYTCRACGRRPEFEDAEAYLLGGSCSSCASAAPAPAEAVTPAPAHP